jgi:hypothetical protein
MVQEKVKELRIYSVFCQAWYPILNAGIIITESGGFDQLLQLVRTWLMIFGICKQTEKPATSEREPQF